MAGPGGREVGRVSIRALPDTSSFARPLQAYLERIEQRLRVELPVSLNQRTVAQAEAQLATLARDREVNIDIDTSTLVRNLGTVGSAGTTAFARWGPLILAATVALGALAAALPAFLAILGAPLAALVLGFEGIKKAASVLKDEVDSLRSSLSATFESGLLPSMEALADIFPVLERGLTAIAEPLVRMFGEVVDALTFSAATGQLDRIFDNIGAALDRLAPAIGPFIGSLLLLAESGTKAFASFAPVLASMTQAFNRFLATMTVSGDLDGAMRALGATFVFIAGVIAVVVGVTISLFAAFARVTKLVGDIPGIFSAAWSSVVATTSATWNRVRATITNAVNGIRSRVSAAWSAVRSVTSSAWSGIQSVVSGAVNRIASVIRGIPGRVRSGLSSLGSIGRNAANAFKSGILGVLDSVVASVKQKIDAIVGKFQEALRLGSPSRVMMQIGEWTGEGFAIGMDRAMASVENIANRMALTPVEATATTRMLPSDFFAASPQQSGPVRVWVENVNEFDGRSARVAEGVVSDEKSFASTMGRMG